MRTTNKSNGIFHKLLRLVDYSFYQLSQKVL